MRCIIVITVFALSIWACKKKKTEDPKPAETSSTTNVNEPTRAAYIDELTIYNLLDANIVDKPFTVFNFKTKDFMASKSDSFDLAFYTRKTKIGGKDTTYYSLCAPSYSQLRLSEGTAIKYPSRKTVFYQPKSATSFFKSMFDTIRYEASIPKIITERFNKVYNTENGEDGYIVQKQLPFLEGQLIGFKTHNGKYGILRITSDGTKAQSIYVKMEVKYQR